MKGNNMKSSKERKMDKKSKHKALSVAKTEASRQRRLDNKAKRDAIHAIYSNIKVHIINQVTYNDDGIEIKVENGKIIKCLPLAIPEVFKSDPETVEVDNNIIKTIIKKWRL